VKNDLYIKNGITIPDHELEIATSRAGGPGGQHVNKTDTRITVRWNVNTTQALTEEQKTRVLEKLHNRLTSEGELIIHNSTSRSQNQNKKNALLILAQEIGDTLYIAKKRIATKVSKTLKEARLKSKSHRSSIKKMRGKRIIED